MLHSRRWRCWSPPAAAQASLHPLLGIAAKGKPDPGSGGIVPFYDACGVALDSEDHLYVSDYHHSVVDVFAVAPPTSNT